MGGGTSAGGYVLVQQHMCARVWDTGGGLWDRINRTVVSSAGVLLVQCVSQQIVRAGDDLEVCTLLCSAGGPLVPLQSCISCCAGAVQALVHMHLGVQRAAAARQQHHGCH
jgi:hypothetical protein